MSVLTDPVDPDATTLEALIDRYTEAVAAAAEGLDPAGAAEAPEPGAIEAAARGDADGLSLGDAVAILAIDAGRDPAAAVAAVRDHLLLEMSGAVMDVEALARAVEADLEPGEIQAMVEGRLPMTLEEYARLHHAIARTDR